ncbi:hypothetical protein [Streptomyces vinaceus]|uniref:hypothetical protein n=1 Tax=Streptomyces vinaceus TaxID=1960 RepID=UPI00382ED0B4
MRTRLYAAVRELLTDTRLAKAKDAVRLAAVVVLAKSPAKSLRVPVRTRDLAGWLGSTESYIAHTVLPNLRKLGIVTSVVDTADSGEVTGLSLRLEPLREARASVGQGIAHPLALTQGELATLLRLCEAVIGPGWQPKNKPSTAPGLLAERRGRGAATDRLALLMLVLQSRPDGRVRMVGGTVAAGRGRADATVARLLRCSVSGGAKVLDRLELRGLVEVPRSQTESGCFGRGRMIVPAVAHASGWKGLDQEPVPQVVDEGKETGAARRCDYCADQASDDEADLAMCGDGWEQSSLEHLIRELEEDLDQRPADASDDLEADETAAHLALLGAQHGHAARKAVTAERPVATALHTTHTPVVKQSGFRSGDHVGFSGSAVRGHGRLPERVRAREDQPSGQAVSASADRQKLGRPLRGDQQIFASGKRLIKGPDRSVFPRGAGIPQDLADVLSPVDWLWSRLGRTSTSRWLAAAVRTELTRMRGLVGEETARRAMAERLERRVRSQAGQPVQDLVGWVLRRGLPQRAGCWSVVCDDGVRMDTGGPCPSCDTVLADRRAVRRALAAQVAAELPRLSGQTLRGEIERRLHHHVQLEAVADSVRRERQLAERAQREAAWERRRAALAAQKAERVAAACADCGVEQAAGLCLTCTYRRRVEVLIGQAVDVVVAMRGAVTSRETAEQFSSRVETDTRALVERGCADAPSHEPAVLAFTAATVAQDIAERRRRSALARLERCEEAEAEAEQAFEAAMRRQHRHLTPAVAREAAEKAAAKARQRAAEALLTEFLARLRQLRGADGGGASCTGRHSRIELTGQVLLRESSARSRLSEGSKEAAAA